MVCSSSMKSNTSPASCASLITRLMRSSNSPLYLEPATMPPISRETSRFPLIESGTLSFMSICASPSTIAVLPTPGSPMRQGLFLVRLESICITLSISAFRPIMGSIFPLNAFSVRSVEYLSRVGVWEDLSCALLIASLTSGRSSPIMLSMSL